MSRRIGIFSLAAVCILALSVAVAARAQSDAPPADVQARWTESLGKPSVYVQHARAEVDQGHYKSAARHLRKAAALLEQQSQDVYGSDRRRIQQDEKALRLTARDVASGAVTSAAQLNSVLDSVHFDLQKRAVEPP